jgi:ribosomal protein L39E
MSKEHKVEGGTIKLVYRIIKGVKIPVWVVVKEGGQAKKTRVSK